MAQMSSGELRAILDSERASALKGGDSAKLAAERKKALDYYLGNMDNDLPVIQDTESSAVSSDVSDTVEGLMPDLMDILCGSDEVVRFEPTGQEDVEAAEQETDYVNHVFMRQNPGFMIIYSFVKDALINKIGAVKVYWESKEEEVEEMYYDLTDEMFALVVSEDGVEVIEHTEKDAPDAGPSSTPEFDAALE